jgi:hypothetical protein
MSDPKINPVVAEDPEDPAAPAVDPETEDDDADPEGADALGEPGKKALDTMKAKWKAEKKRAGELAALVETLQAPKPSEDGTPDIEVIKAEAVKEANKKANTRIVRAEIRAAAAGKLADPTDAALYLDLDQFEVDENGDVDSEEIADAITDLIKRKPHLAGTATGRFQGTADQGARKAKPQPSQLSQADLKKMSPAEIVKAKADGRLNDLLGIK